MRQYRFQGSRVARRRFLRSSAVGGAGAALLAACGDNSNGNGGESSTTGARPTPPTGEPKPGGRLVSRRYVEPPNWSVLAASAHTAAFASLAYSKLLRMHQGYPDTAASSTQLEEDLASKYEQPDELSTVFTIRDGVTWHNVPPTNGRPLTVEEIKQSMEAYRTDKNSAFKADWAPVERIETPDAHTIRVVTKEPFAPLLNTAIGGHYGARIFPMELLEGDKIKTEAVGTGPFIRDSYLAGDRAVYKRNPTYFRQGIPYLDELVLQVIPDESSNAAAFQAEEIDATALTCDDAEQVQRAKSDTVQFEELGTGGYISLNTSKPPFSDKRVRQALAMGYNRMAERAALFCGRGEMDQILPPGNVDRALKVSELGEASKYWEHNPGEAKKLLEAAGYPDGFETPIVYTPQYGDVYRSALERVIGDWAQIGVKLQSPQSVEYSQWISSIYRPPFNFEGILWGPGRVYTDPEPYLWFWLHPEGITNQARVNDQRATDLLLKQRRTLNVEERWNVIHDIERLAAEEQWYTHRNTGVLINVTQPWVKNWGPEKQSAELKYEHVWIDRG
ncbi:MAG: ABC transporter substrate-binding protein [Dehalococcoidia bacterium]